jgi:hypothetical protein
MSSIYNEYCQATSKNLKLTAPGMEKKFRDRIRDYLISMKLIPENRELIREYIFEILSEPIQPSIEELAQGDLVVNVNPECDHYKSTGIVLGIIETPAESENVIDYCCTNSGPNWKIDDVLRKTADQLAVSSLAEIAILEEVIGDMGIGPDSNFEGFPKNRWVLLSPGDPHRELIKQELYDLTHDVYKELGGHPKISSPDSLERYTYWVIEDLDADPDIDVAMFGKPKPGGQKLGAVGHDGSGAAISAYKSKSAELRSGGSIGGVGNWWGEVSGKPAYALLRRGAPVVEDEETARMLLAGKPVEWHGAHPDPNAPDLFKAVNGWYTRHDLGHTKIIIGNPSL